MNEEDIKKRISEIYEKGDDRPSYSAEEIGLEPMSEEEAKEEFKGEIKMMEEEQNSIEELMFDIVMALIKKESERYQRLYSDFEKYCETVEMYSLCYEFDSYLEELKSLR